MINRMDTDTMSLIRASETEIQLSIGEITQTLSIDELEQLRNLASAFWDHNNLWHLTTRAKQEREMHRLELSVPQPLPM